ncbi:YfjI family protein [Psychrobacter aquimaris]|uniref:YfjI family protein n=1 Tax=Psychrobacter aquimaris TaxID=292733 RepID=UPI0039C6B2AE
MSQLTKEKAHAQGMGLDQYLADFKPATLADVAGNDKLEDLINILGNTYIYKLHCDITILSGELKGEIQLGTANSIGLVMQDSKTQVVNLASIPIKGESKPFIADTAKPSAFILGAMRFNDVIIAIDNLTDAINCYNSYKEAGIPASIITSVVPSLFVQTVAEFAQVRQITVNVTAMPADEAKLKRLEGMNVQAVICEHTPIYEAMQYGASYNELLADANIIYLKTIGYPQPKPIVQTLPLVKTFTKDMMPELLWNYTSNCAERLSVPIEYVLIPLVVSLGSVIGTKLTIYPKKYDNWEISPNFFGAIVGNPSSKKSPSLAEGLKPITHLVALAQERYSTDKLEYEAQKELNKHMAKATEKQLGDLAKKLANQTDDDDNESNQEMLKAKAQELAQAKQNDELIPEMKRYITDDGTIESLGELESKHKNGILAKRDELTGLLASLDNESNLQARSFYLEGFNGLSSFQVDRIGRGSIFIETHCLSVIGGIQPDKLEYYLSKATKGLGNDGLIQRFQLMVYPDPLPNSKEKDLPPDKESRDAMYSLFETIDNMQLGDFMKYGANPIDEYHKRPYYRFSDEAYPIFMSWYDDLKVKANNAEHGIIAEHLIKYAKTVPSLALIFHLIDCIEYGGDLGAVTDTALKAAINWCEVLQTHMMRAYSAVTDSANIKASYLADKILKVVKQGTDKTDKTDWLEHGFTARQLIRRGWKGLTDADDVINALEVLIEHDWLRWETVESTGQGGRPTERYYINPRIKELL